MPSDLDPVLERRPTAAADFNRRDAIATEREAEAPSSPAQALLTVGDVLTVASAHADAISAIAEAKRLVEAREADAMEIQRRLDAIGAVIGPERLQAILAQSAASQSDAATTESHEARDIVESATDGAHSFSGAQTEESRGSLWSGRRAGFAFGKPRP